MFLTQVSISVGRIVRNCSNTSSSKICSLERILVSAIDSRAPRVCWKLHEAQLLCTGTAGSAKGRPHSQYHTLKHRALIQGGLDCTTQGHSHRPLPAMCNLYGTWSGRFKFLYFCYPPGEPPMYTLRLGQKWEKRTVVVTRGQIYLP